MTKPAIALDSNATGRLHRPAPGDAPRRCVHQLIQEQTAKTPDRAAIMFEGWSLTYGEVNAQANRLARHLRALGVGPETLVGLCVDRSPDMITGLLGVLKAGGAYVPLDPTYPQERLALMVEDSRTPVIVTQPHLLERLPEHHARVVALGNELWQKLDFLAPENLSGGAGPDDLAYVIYTSGSTGTPKGVMIPHRALANYAKAAGGVFEIVPDDRVLQFASVSFDTSAEEIYPCLSRGGTLVLRTPTMLDSLAHFLDRVREWGITVLDFPTAYWHELVVVMEAESLPLPECVRLVIIGGEKASAERFAIWRRLVAPYVRLVNGYGPTETTIAVTLSDVAGPRVPECDVEEVPIGRPVANNFIDVLDPDLAPVPAGQPGELHIGGAGLARGYLNRPDLTAEKFIPDPRRPGGRLYKTGDLGRYREDGQLEFLGRVDFQVKVRGYRIELGEVEAAIGQHPSVRDAVVVARPDASGQQMLAAFVVPREGSVDGLDIAELRGFLRSNLPGYMVPAHILPLAALPLTPANKIDRGALPDPGVDLLNASQDKAGPRNDFERALAALWEEVLDVRPVGVTDNFFDLGGHSLLAAELTRRIQQQLGHNLPLGALLTAPTVQALVSLMERRPQESTPSSIIPLHSGGDRPPLFLAAGIGGHVFTFREFAHLLGDDQPVYGLEAIGVDGSQVPPDRMEDIAAHYVREITTLYPHGPYLLGGYSLGAVTAFAVAQHLTDLGRRVELLIVFDMLAPGYPRDLPLPRKMRLHWRRLAGLGWREKGRYLHDRVHSVGVRILSRLGLERHRGPSPGEMESLRLPKELRPVYVALSTALERYRPPRPFDGRTVLFTSGESSHGPPTLIDDPLLGWGQWANGGLEHHTLAGRHNDLFSGENVEAMAVRVREYIADFESARSRDVNDGLD
jgi:amino acid adenylation domain-containing protein